MIIYNESNILTEQEEVLIAETFLTDEKEICSHGLTQTYSDLQNHGQEIREQHYALLMGWA